MRVLKEENRLVDAEGGDKNMGDTKELPPLPGSDEESLKRDSYDHFYKKRPSDIWTGRIERKKIEESPKCRHFFKETQEGVQCEKCHFGLLGKDLKVIKGHVYFEKQKLF